MGTRSSGGGEGDGASRRSQHPLSIGLGLVRQWGTGGYGEPRTLHPGPHLPLYSATRWGAISHENGWAPPIMARIKGPIGCWANLVEINLTFSPLISPYDLNLTYFIFFSFHHKSVHRVCFIVMVICH